MTELYLVRHGETDWNVEKRFRGRADIPLNARGVQQAQAVAERIRHLVRPVAIYSSPVRRALDTAEAIAERAEVVVKQDERLADIDYGSWQGLTHAEVQERFPAELATFHEAPSFLRIPHGEHVTFVRQRATAFLAEVESRHPGLAIVVVSHTEIIRLMILIALRLTTDALWRIEQHPCAISQLRVESERWTVTSMNDTCHLEGL